MAKKFNLAKIYKIIKKEFDRNWSDVEFNYVMKDDYVNVFSTETSLKNIKDAMIYIRAYDSYSSLYSVCFGELDNSLEVLRLINNFNSNSSFFRLSLSEDGTLFLENSFFCKSEADFGWYLSECMKELLVVDEDEDLLEVLKFVK